MACVIVLSNKCDITRASLEADQQEPNPCYAVGTSSESPCVSWGRMSSRILLFAHVHVLHDLLLHVCEVCFFIEKKKKKQKYINTSQHYSFLVVASVLCSLQEFTSSCKQVVMLCWYVNLWHGRSAKRPKK